MQPFDTPSSTRDRILQTAYELLLQQGYHGTGLKQILDRANVPKGSFYHYFDSKEHLAVELVECYRQSQKRRWCDEFRSEQGDRLSQIRRGLQTLLEELKPSPDPNFGCLLATLSGELTTNTPFLRRAIDNANQAITQDIADDLRCCQAQGSIRGDLAPEALAQLFWSAWQGAALQYKASRSIHPLEQVVELLLERFFQPTAPTPAR